MEDEFIIGDKTAKLKFFVIVVLAIIYFVLENFSGLMIDQTTMIIQSESESAMRMTFNVLLLEKIVTTLILWRLSMHVIRLGLNTRHSGQWPPPGMKVPFRTKIRRGDFAKLAWICCFIFAGWLFLKPSLDLYSLYNIKELL